MSNPDLLLYGVHAAFWGSFWLARSRAGRSGASDAAPAAKGERTAPHSRAVMAVHFGAFFVMYLGVGNAVLPNRVPSWFWGQRIVGTLVIATGAALMAWAVLYFRSWRFRAKLEEGHQLATEGPFRLLRHPIYMGMNLLALGTAIWAPTVITGAGLALMALGSDLRARKEEPLLLEAFGEAYAEYCRRTKRFVPGIY